MYKLIIFDMDGVLVDSEPAITLAAMESLQERGITAQYDDFKPYTGMGDDLFIGGVSEKYGLPYELSMKARAYEIYMERTDRVEVYPDSLRLLKELRDEGYALAVASASDLVKVKVNLKRIGVEPEFLNALVTGSDVERKKPDPEIFLKAAKKAGFEPSDCLVVEDALSGAMAAKSAGMTCATVTTSFDADRLRAAGADYVADRLYGVKEFIDGRTTQ
ncbi:MAG: HAD family hydrolase [Eubacteriales bacterium]